MACIYPNIHQPQPHKHMHTSTHLSVYIQARTQTHTHWHACAHACAHAHTHMHACSYSETCFPVKSNAFIFNGLSNTTPAQHILTLLIKLFINDHKCCSTTFMQAVIKVFWTENFLIMPAFRSVIKLFCAKIWFPFNISFTTNSNSLKPFPYTITAPNKFTIQNAFRCKFIVQDL